MIKFILNPTIPAIIIFSFVIVYGGVEGISIPSRLEPALNILAPMAAGFREASQFPQQSYIYFLIMQPVCFVAFFWQWSAVASSLNFSSIQLRYSSMNYIMRTASWLFVYGMMVLGASLYIFMGGQNLPGTRINSSRINLAVFGPIAAAGLSVFIMVFFANIARCYLAVEKRGAWCKTQN